MLTIEDKAICTLRGKMRGLQDTDLYGDQALKLSIIALEKQIPKEIDHLQCPSCGLFLTDHTIYCPNCGQKLLRGVEL
ncbi:MAG: hypothetical protein RSB90_10375 [Eubacterium sp.]